MCDPKTKAKIIWNCRRGMLELDLMLTRFINKELENLNPKQLLLFQDLLTQQDPDLYAWFMGYEQPTNKEFSDLIASIHRANHA